MNKNEKTWTFPQHIGFEMVIQYIIEFEETQWPGKIVFDLSKTKYIHSSLIGLLINAKQKAEKINSGLSLLISPEIEKIFIKMNLVKFLPYMLVKKSA